MNCWVLLRWMSMRRARLNIFRVVVKDSEDIAIQVGSRELMKHVRLGLWLGCDRGASRLPLRVLRIDLSLAIEVQPRDDGRRVATLFPELRIGQEDPALPARDARYAVVSGSAVDLEAETVLVIVEGGFHVAHRDLGHRTREGLAHGGSPWLLTLASRGCRLRRLTLNQGDT